MRHRAFIVCVFVVVAAVGNGCSPSRDPPEGSGSERVEASAEADSAARIVLVSDLESIIELAIDIYDRAEYDSVRALLTPALQQAQTQNDSAAEARILTVLGQAAYREGDFSQAREVGEKALQLKLRIGLASELARSYNALGLLAWTEARRSDALELYEKALQSATGSGVDSTRAGVSINRGLIYADLGDFDQARSSLITGRDLSIEIGNARWATAAINNLAMVQIWTGNPAGAVSTLEQAIRSFDSLDYAHGKINALGQLGTAYAAIGEIGNAITVLDSAITFARERGLRDEEASNLEALAEAHRTVGDYRRALALFERAEAINEEMGLVEETGADQRSRAQIYSLLGEPALALEFAWRALETHESVDARWEELADHVMLADLEHQVGNRVESAAHIRAAKRLARDCDARTARIDVALAEARIAERDEQPELVLRVIGAASADLFAGGYDAEWESEVLRARAFLSLSQDDSAAAAAHGAVLAVERVRAEAGSSMLRTAYGSKRAEAYEALIAARLSQGNIDAAFEAADRSRGRALLEGLAARPADAAEGASQRRDLRETERLLTQIGRLTAELRDEEVYPPEDRDDAIMEDLRARLAGARTDYEALLAGTEDRDQTDLALLGGSAAGAQRIVDVLEPDEALLLYLVVPDEVIQFVATHAGIEMFMSAVSNDVLARRVRIVRDLVGFPDTDRELARAALTGLHEVLLSPALQSEYLSGISRIVVVPHGVLNYLPFAALVDPTSGRFLVEDFNIQVLPSAAALPVLRDRYATASRVEAEMMGGIALAPFPETLPSTRTEVRAFTETMRRGSALTGNRATESRLRVALTQPALVHVATHGVMNVRNPLFSRLDLTAGSGDPNDDGRLEVHELLDLSISSPLVFLSGCETGVGIAGSTEFARGEDYATLALAFLYAGASNVVATLWPIEDDGAAVFAEAFYAKLIDRGPAGALAAAQREMISHERYGAPFYWAGYQLAGAGEVNQMAQISGR
ncbi:CHAT domain-containing protein [Gemmatimonadota bacterium]